MHTAADIKQDDNSVQSLCVTYAENVEWVAAIDRFEVMGCQRLN